MPFSLTGQTVRFIHREWELDGRSGVSHQLTVADGDDLFTVKVPQDLLDVLDSGTIERLGVVGYNVVVELAEPRAYQRDGGNPRVNLRARGVRIVDSVSVDG
jgi:hypothetical protein